MINNKAPDIGLVFYKGLFSDEEIKEIKSQFDTNYLCFDAREKNVTVQASLDFFVPVAQIILSPDFLQQIAFGVISSFVYDLAKTCFLRIWSSITAKRPKKIIGKKITDYENCIHLCGNGFSAVFPQTTDEKIVLDYINRSFEYLSHNTTVQREFLVLDNDRKIQRYTEQDIIEMALREQRKGGK